MMGLDGWAMQLPTPQNPWDHGGSGRESRFRVTGAWLANSSDLKIPLLARDPTIASIRAQTMSLYARVPNHLRWIRGNLSVSSFFCLKWADPARFLQKNSGLRDDPYSHWLICKGQDAPLQRLLQPACMISPASITRFSGNTCFKGPNRIWVKICTKSSRWTQSKSWDTCSAVLAHAHEWRQLSRCSFYAKCGHP